MNWSRSSYGSSWSSENFDAAVGSTAGCKSWTSNGYWSTQASRKPCKNGQGGVQPRRHYAYPSDEDWCSNGKEQAIGSTAGLKNSRINDNATRKLQQPEMLIEALQVVALCGEAKARLIAARAGVPGEQVEAVSRIVRKKNASLKSQLRECGLEESLLQDMQAVLEQDLWDGDRAGREWLRDWVEVAEMAEEFAQAATAASRPYWCSACSRDLADEWSLDHHQQGKDHFKKVKNFMWRYGREPPGTKSLPAGIPPAPVRPPPRPQKDFNKDALVVHGKAALDEKQVAVVACGHERAACDGAPTSKTTAASKMFAKAQEAATSIAAQAKQKLLEYRDSLSEEERLAVLGRIRTGTNEVRQRANDISGIEDLTPAFPEHVNEWLRQVESKEWIYEEPTFSWLSGFYWHLESTHVPIRGEEHSEFYCHLCFVECYTGDGLHVHMDGRRHAETFQRWVEFKGSTPVPTSCDCCSGKWHSEAQIVGPGSTIDIEVRRKVVAGSSVDVKIPAENNPQQPKGFLSIAGPRLESGVVAETEPSDDLGNKSLPPRPVATSFVAFVIKISDDSNCVNGYNGGNNSSWKNGKNKSDVISKVRVTSTRLRIGPKEAGKKPNCWCVDLDEPLEHDHDGSWRSLAVAVSGPSAAVGSKLEFHVTISRNSSDSPEHVDGRIFVTVPPVGHVAEVVAEIQISSWSGQYGRRWPQAKLQGAETLRVVEVLNFVGSGQVATLGGVQRLRGQQRALQLATEDVMLSFLLHIPKGDELAPLLVFFHGDLNRDISQCQKPGLADFCNQYGPAAICSKPTKEGHSCRKFVVVTPTSPAEYWWFRYPALHDATSYVPSMEQWFRRLNAWLADDVKICHSICAATGHGMRLAGQSMGGYAALELARAMPELVSAIGVGAPCFDAFRLDWLAERLQNVPLWVMIGRHDTMCSYEEVASLILKLRDRDAKLARLSSARIKGHNEACVLLEKEWLYQWFLNPLQRYETDTKAAVNATNATEDENLDSV